MKNNKPLVIVLSRNYSTGLGVIRSLGKAGYTVDLIASTKKKGSSRIASCSKYVRQSVEVICPEIQEDTGDGLLEEIMKYTVDFKGKMVLFPVDDFTASVVATNKDLLKEFFFIPYISGECKDNVLQMMNKKNQEELARKAGLLTAGGWTVSLKEEVVIPKEVCYPCFVKPIQSIAGHKTEMKVCEDVTELGKHLTKLKENNSDRDVLIQQYLHIDKEYDLSGVCLDQDIILPGVIEKSRIAKHEVGVTLSGKMQPLDILKEGKEKVVTLLKNMHYTGMFDMELFLCGDKLYFNEMNFRSGGPNYFYCQNGVNLPAIYVNEITGQGHDVKEEKIQKFGKTFVYEKVAWEDYIYSYMSRKELGRCIKEADYTLLKDKDDPAPGKLFDRRIRLSSMKRKLINIVSKKSNKNVEIKNISSKPEIVVAGYNYCNIITMARAFGEAGYDVSVLRIYKKKLGRFNVLSKMQPEAYSKYVKCYRKVVANGKKERIVNELIKLGDLTQQSLLMPVDDYTASIVDESFEHLKSYYLIPNVNNKEQGIIALMDKNKQKELAAQYGIPVLKSVLINSEKKEFDIPEEVVYPCYIKPNISINGTKAKMAKCNNRKELHQTLSKYAQSEDFEILVEEFVDIKEEYSVLGLSTEDGCVAPGIFKVLKGGHRERKGVTITGEAVSIHEFEDIIDKCREFIKGIHYTGLFDVDLIETTDGKIYFIELNFRAGASMHLFTKTGVNLPGMFADNLMKKVPLKEEFEQHCGKRFVSEKVLLEEYARNDMGIWEVRDCLKKADVFFIKDDQDQEPYKYMKKYFFIATILKLPYRIKDLKAEIFSKL